MPAILNCRINLRGCPVYRLYNIHTKNAAEEMEKNE
jgi:hypothetical protein